MAKFFSGQPSYVEMIKVLKTRLVASVQKALTIAMMIMIT